MPEITIPIDLPKAPSAVAAQAFGLLSILFGACVIGFPLGILFGILSLIKSLKVKRLALEHPNNYSVPSNLGFILCSVGLAFSIVVAPISIVGYIVHLKSLETDCPNVELFKLAQQFAEYRMKLTDIEHQEKKLESQQRDLEKMSNVNKSSNERSQIILDLEDNNREQALVKYKKAEIHKSMQELKTKVEAMANSH